MLEDAVSEDPPNHNDSKRNGEHGWGEKNLFPPPFGRRHEAFPCKPFCNVRIDWDGLNEFRNGSIKLLLLGEEGCFFPSARLLNGDAHRSIGPWLFRNRRASRERVIIRTNLENAHSRSDGAAILNQAWNWRRPLAINSDNSPAFISRRASISPKLNSSM